MPRPPNANPPTRNAGQGRSTDQRRRSLLLRRNGTMGPALRGN